MDGRKDLALRAKEIAVRKMKRKDYRGAWLMLHKAAELFPALEHSTQMLSVCNILQAANPNIPVYGINWHWILQLPSSMDEEIVRARFQDLALCLEPIKNEFPGTDVALELLNNAMFEICDQARHMSSTSSQTVSGCSQSSSLCNREVRQEDDQSILKRAAGKSCGSFQSSISDAGTNDESNEENDTILRMFKKIKKSRSGRGNLGDKRATKSSISNAKAGETPYNSERISRKLPAKVGELRGSVEDLAPNSVRKNRGENGKGFKRLSVWVGGLKNVQPKSVTGVVGEDPDLPSENDKRSCSINGEASKLSTPVERILRKLTSMSPRDAHERDDSLVPYGISNCGKVNGQQHKETLQEGTKSPEAGVRDKVCADLESSNFPCPDLSLSPEIRTLKNRVFSALPQDPHYRPLTTYGSEIRNWMIIALEMAFVNISEKIRNLTPQDIKSGNANFMKELSELEDMGYNVEKLQARLETLGEIGRQHQSALDAAEDMEVQAKECEVELGASEIKFSTLSTRLQELEAEIAKSEKEMESAQALMDNQRSKVENLNLEISQLNEATLKSQSEFASVARLPW
ncbi:hypothetical protein H6P81_012659 [Aristolochia fimbriata]|uniref:Uncharacterized protein n=1 Tax=Aristolochia fimbriata TaxID=158543 RepID=A0AAV7EFB5_ARIFI|nr:hypothetical protein H6P81_012659 [Aristolochia fimbriata]